MGFKLHDTVVVFTKPHDSGPVVGMRGFIDEVFENDYYRFSYVGNLPNGIEGVPPKSYGEGGIHGKYLAHDDGPRLIEVRDIIIREREELENKMLAQIELKKIIEKD